MRMCGVLQISQQASCAGLPVYLKWENYLVIKLIGPHS